MELKDIKKLLKKAFEKTGITAYKISTKFDEECELGFFNDRFYLNNVLTPYSTVDFSEIRYYVDSEGESSKRNNVRIYFENGDTLELKPYGRYEANINGVEYSENESVLEQFRNITEEPERSFTVPELRRLI